MVPVVEKLVMSLFLLYLVCVVVIGGGLAAVFFDLR